MKGKKIQEYILCHFYNLFLPYLMIQISKVHFLKESKILSWKVGLWKVSLSSQDSWLPEDLPTWEGPWPPPPPPSLGPSRVRSTLPACLGPFCSCPDTVHATHLWHKWAAEGTVWTQSHQLSYLPEKGILTQNNFSDSVEPVSAPRDSLSCSSFSPFFLSFFLLEVWLTCYISFRYTA